MSLSGGGECVISVGGLVKEALGMSNDMSNKAGAADSLVILVYPATFSACICPLRAERLSNTKE